MNTFEEFVIYLQSIIKSCAGFIKTDGNFLHVPGSIFMMSDDHTVVSIINIPVKNDIVFGGNINTFLNLEKIDCIEKLTSMLYFIGSNILVKRLESIYNLYISIINRFPLEVEDDCNMIPGFEEASQLPDMNPIKYIGKNGIKYILYIAKWLLPMNKGDTCGMYIYPNYELITTCYKIHKKKLKLDINIMYNTIPYVS